MWEKKGIHKPLQKGPIDILLFRSLNKTHLGTYTCKVSSPQGTAVATYNLWIDGKEGKTCPQPCPPSPSSSSPPRANVTLGHQPSRGCTSRCWKPPLG